MRGLGPSVGRGGLVNAPSVYGALPRLCNTAGPVYGTGARPRLWDKEDPLMGQNWVGWCWMSGLTLRPRLWDGSKG
ncbi:hypothetical protein DRN97_04860, partial [Methanosarcinales archaeon]